MKFYIIMDMWHYIDGERKTIFDGGYIEVYDDRDAAERDMLMLQAADKRRLLYLFEAVSLTEPTGVYRDGDQVYRIINSGSTGKSENRQT
jgi:hypothetical protein